MDIIDFSDDYIPLKTTLYESINETMYESKWREILFGNVSKPTVIKYGHGCFYTNKSGDVIDYPNAYAKRGWSNMVYHCAVPSIIVLPYEIIKW